MSPPNDGIMEASMGKALLQFSTDPETQRRIRHAHELRNAYIRAALGRLLRRSVALFTRPRPEPSAEYSPVRLRADVDPRR
jgi:hypothetical protein